MNKLVGAFACSLVMAACADRTPARDPSTASGYSSPQESAAPRQASTVSPATPPDLTQRTDADSSAHPRTEPTPTTGMNSGDSNQPMPPAAVTDNPGKGDQTKSADNTKNNDRDRHGTLTPGNQGNSSAETRITADIRKGLMSSSALSFTAKNAKVITVGTKVTLRGAVKSDAEKSEIERVAKSTNGVTEVDNQLEVKK